MNCIDIKCKYCKAKDVKLDSEIIPRVMEVFCEKGKPVHTVFNDNGKPFTCRYYERYDNE